MSEDRQTTDSATLSESARIEVTPAETATQAEPPEIARQWRLTRIERAARALLEARDSHDVSMAFWDLKIAYYAPPAPPPDEPRLTREELIALTEDAEQYLAGTDYQDAYERNKRTRDESRAAIAKARDLIGRGEDRLYPERFALAPEPKPASDAPEPLTVEELQTLAASAEHWRYQLERNPATAPHTGHIRAAIARADALIKHMERKP